MKIKKETTEPCFCSGAQLMDLQEEEEEVVNFGKSIIVPSVQELAKQPIINIPPRYLRHDDQDPLILLHHTCLPSVPIIDLKKLVAADSMDYELERLHSACKDWGFFQVCMLTLFFF